MNIKTIIIDDIETHYSVTDNGDIYNLKTNKKLKNKKKKLKIVKVIRLKFNDYNVHHECDGNGEYCNEDTI